MRKRWPSESIAAAVSVLRESGRLECEADGADERLVEKILNAAVAPLEVGAVEKETEWIIQAVRLYLKASRP